MVLYIVATIYGTNMPFHVDMAIHIFIAFVASYTVQSRRYNCSEACIESVLVLT